MGDVKYMDIREFQELGFLQEANRQFFHPHGLALEVTRDDDGSAHISGVWDYRDDPEGVIFGDSPEDKAAKAERARTERERHAQARYTLFYGDGAVELDEDEPEDFEPLDWTTE